MARVLKLPSPLERGAHNTGPAFCSQCHHEWQAVTQVGAVVLECPNCHTWKGLMKGPVEPEFGVWTCNCGCQAASAGYQRDLWQVDISLGGESILTISHNHLGGLENISDYEEVIEKCADHLLAFIGKRR